VHAKQFIGGEGRRPEAIIFLKSYDCNAFCSEIDLYLRLEWGRCVDVGRFISLFVIVLCIMYGNRKPIEKKKKNLFSPQFCRQDSSVIHCMKLHGRNAMQENGLRGGVRNSCAILSASCYYGELTGACMQSPNEFWP
jgi:hypothetical protein